MNNLPAALLADIGGTNARFALLRDGVIEPPMVVSTADFATLHDALLHALSSLRAPALAA
ncbi:MAG: glucokinase, partial [Gammaproteobacteria bacterium]